MKHFNKKLHVKFLILLIIFIQIVNSQNPSNSHIDNHIHQTNENIDEQLLFLNDLDYHKTPSKLNYKGNNKKGVTDEFKARLYVYKWAKMNQLKYSLKSVKSSNEAINNWKVLIVSAKSSQGTSINKKVCFPNNPKENYGLVVDSNENCVNKISKMNDFLNKNVDTNESDKVLQNDIQEDHVNHKANLLDSSSSINKVLEINDAEDRDMMNMPETVNINNQNSQESNLMDNISNSLDNQNVASIPTNVTPVGTITPQKKGFLKAKSNMHFKKRILNNSAKIKSVGINKVAHKSKLNKRIKYVGQRKVSKIKPLSMNNNQVIPKQSKAFNSIPFKKNKVKPIINNSFANPELVQTNNQIQGGLNNNKLLDHNSELAYLDRIDSTNAQNVNNQSLEKGVKYETNNNINTVSNSNPRNQQLAQPTNQLGNIQSTNSLNNVPQPNQSLNRNSNSNVNKLNSVNPLNNDRLPMQNELGSNNLPQNNLNSRKKIDDPLNLKNHNSILSNEVSRGNRRQIDQIGNNMRSLKNDISRNRLGRPENNLSNVSKRKIVDYSKKDGFDKSKIIKKDLNKNNDQSASSNKPNPVLKKLEDSHLNNHYEPKKFLKRSPNVNPSLQQNSLLINRKVTRPILNTNNMGLTGIKLINKSRRLIQSTRSTGINNLNIRTQNSLNENNHIDNGLGITNRSRVGKPHISKSVSSNRIVNTQSPQLSRVNGVSNRIVNTQSPQLNRVNGVSNRIVNTQSPQLNRVNGVSNRIVNTQSPQLNRVNGVSNRIVNTQSPQLNRVNVLNEMHNNLEDVGENIFHDQVRRKAGIKNQMKEEKLLENAENGAPSRLNKSIAENYVSSYQGKIFLF